MGSRHQERIGVDRNSKPINERFAHLVGNASRSDFKFIIEEDGVVIPGHKFVVGAGSSVLDKIVYGTAALESVNSTEVDQISSKSFLELLRYLYTDTANITDENAVEIMKKANYYDLGNLENMCIDVLLVSVNRKNCCPYYSRLFAYYSYNVVVKKCLEFIQFAPTAIFVHDEFYDLEIAALKEIFTFDVINCTDLDMYEALLKWATTNCTRLGLPVTAENKRQLVEDAEQLIRFTTLSEDQFSRCLALDPEFLTAEEVQRIRAAISNKTGKEVRRKFLTFQDVTWVDRSVEDDDMVAPYAIHVGFDNDQNAIYLGRAEYGDTMYPVEVIPALNTAFYYCESLRREVEYYEMLVGTGYEWVRVDNGKIPPGAVVASNDSDEVPLYIGRGSSYNEFLTVGRVDKDGKCIFVCDFHSSIEYEVAAFEVLVGHNVRPPPVSDTIPLDAISAGFRGTEPIYLGKAFHRGDSIPAVIVPNEKIAFFTGDGEEHQTGNYEYLRRDGFDIEWVPSRNGDIVSNAIGCNVITDKGSDKREILFFGRVEHDGTLVYGKVQPSNHALFISGNGAEHEYSEYEILVKRV